MAGGARRDSVASIGHHPAMAELYLVRHAQAAFGTDDYDRLTDLGHRQAAWLGGYFNERGMTFDRVLAGTLRRHRETIDGIASAGVSLAPTKIDAGLDEYDPERLLTAHLAATAGRRSEPAPPLHLDSIPRGVRAEPADDAASAVATRKHHFRQLRDALTAWTQGQLDPEAHRPFDRFQQDAYRAFELAWQAERSDAKRVLIVSSGGPIASIVARHLEMPVAHFVTLNLQIRNSGFCEIRFNARGAQLISFNNVPHLDTLERRQHITFA